MPCVGNAAQVWVYGNSFKSCLLAVVVPIKEVVVAWAKENGVSGDYAALCADEKVKAYVLAVGARMPALRWPPGPHTPCCSSIPRRLGHWRAQCFFGVCLQCCGDVVGKR